MKKSLFLSVLALFFASTAHAADPAEGLWLTENHRSVIEVKECEQGLCGKIHWIIKDGMQFDEKNPDEAKRSTPMCGLPILWGFTNDAPGVWEEGRIYKADEGDIYHANLEMLEDGTLKVRGYVGVSFLGKTQIWTRAANKDYPRCRPAK